MRKAFYPNLVAEMIRHGDTARTLAESMNLTYSAIWRRMSGRQDWLISEITFICERYNMSFEELFKRGV